MVSGAAGLRASRLPAPLGFTGWEDWATGWTGRAPRLRLLQCVLGTWKMSAEWVWGKYSWDPFLPRHAILLWG